MKLIVYSNILASMISEVDKFRATSLQIAGFSFMVPLGNLIVNLLEFKRTGVDEEFYMYLGTSIFLLVVGIILIAIADFILRKGESR